MYVQNSKTVLFLFSHAGGDGTDPFAAQEEEKPNQDVPQVSSPQPASPTGSSGQTEVDFTDIWKNTVFSSMSLIVTHSKMWYAAM